MKTAALILAIPVFIFVGLTLTLDIGALLPLIPDYDYTPYLAARSLARDMDLACTQADSDRYFRETGSRPSHFRVADRRVLFSSGDYRQYPVFFEKDLFVFLL